MESSLERCPADQSTTPAVLHGFLPVPAAVSEHVQEEALRAEREHAFALTPEARQRMLNKERSIGFTRINGSAIARLPRASRYWLSGSTKCAISPARSPRSSALT